MNEFWAIVLTAICLLGMFSSVLLIYIFRGWANLRSYKPDPPTEPPDVPAPKHYTLKAETGYFESGGLKKSPKRPEPHTHTIKKY